MVLYFTILLLGALVGKFVYMFNDVFGNGNCQKLTYVDSIAGEGPADSAKRWLIYHKKAIVGRRILNDTEVPAELRTDIDIGIDHAQAMLNAGGPCEITITAQNSFHIHVVNEILFELAKLVDREINATKSNMFYKSDGVYKSTLFIR